MFNWFQALLPRKGDFFGMFEAHAAALVGAAAALQHIADDRDSTASATVAALFYGLVSGEFARVAIAIAVALGALVILLWRGWGRGTVVAS